ncbi:hypothetical protein VaNZ11_013848 [Volvox africanus]|uniref:Plasma membrane fusion protein PRM1 n=1 Tax=Volvox africanus TaxID=51714 RepID=A0ABQ5SH41_9CHLO|nr:hypothetical protein VaNZ11_013848 [Volvox africanus]
MGSAAESCPSALWQKLPFLPEPPTPGFNLLGWSKAQYLSYAKATILSATAVNVAFLGIVVVLFLFLLVWRLLGGICLCCSVCCGVKARMPRRKSLLSFEVMHDPWLLGHKVAFAFFAFGCIVLAITGLATLPQLRQQIDELASRLEEVSNYASSLLATSDGLLGSASSLRPIMSQVLTLTQPQMASKSLLSDMECSSAFLDAGLVQAESLRSQIATFISSWEQFTPLISTAAALLNITITPAPLGATPSMEVVSNIRVLLIGIDDALEAYNTALTALPESRQPTSVSDPQVNALTAAQNTVNITQWITSLDLLSESMKTLDVAAQNLLYSRLGSTFREVLIFSVSLNSKVNTILSNLDGLDRLYMSGQRPPPSPQQQQSTVAGRACLLSMVQQLLSFDTSIFRFNSTLERNALDTIYNVTSTLEQIYRGDPVGISTDAGAGATNALIGNGTVVPTELARPAWWASQYLQPLGNVDGPGFANQCYHVQSMLTDENNRTKVPDLTPILSHISILRSTLVGLQRPFSGVQAALVAYNKLASEVLYSSLIAAVNTTKPALGSALNVSSPAFPGYGPGLWATAWNGWGAVNDVPRGGLSVDERLRLMSKGVFGLNKWMTEDVNGLVGLKRTLAGLSAIGSSVNQAQTVLVRSGLANTSNSQIGINSTVTGGGGSNTSAPSSPPPASPASPAALRKSAFLRPMVPSMQIITSTLSDGVASVAEQLDNALGKALLLISPPPPPPPPMAVDSPPPPAPSPPPPRPALLLSLQPTTSPLQGNEISIPFVVRPLRQLQQSAGAFTSPDGANITTVVYRQLVKPLNELNATLRGKTGQRYLRNVYSSAVAVYSCLIVVCLLMGVALFFNFPAGLVIGLGVHLLLATLVLAGAWAAAMGMVASHDACGNFDSMVLDAVSPSSSLFPLLRYYLQGVGGSLTSILRTTGLGDIVRLKSAVNLVRTEVLGPLLLPRDSNRTAGAANSTRPWPSSIGTVQYALGELLVDLDAMAANVADQLTALLTVADRANVLHQYGIITWWPCCSLGEQLLVAWISATGCGLLAWLAALSTLLVLKNLDDMPVGSRWGCTCYDPRDFPQPVRRRRYKCSAGGGEAYSIHGYQGGSASSIGLPPMPTVQMLAPCPLRSPGGMQRSYSGRTMPSIRSQDIRPSYDGYSLANARVECIMKITSEYDTAGAPRELAVKG